MVCSELNISNTELQCVLLFGSDLTGNRIRFLDNCVSADTPEEFVGTLDMTQWYAMPEVRYQVIPQTHYSPFIVIRALSEDVFQIDWPRVSTQEIRQVAARKRIQNEIGVNAESLCIVY
jgi:hypothetical protein